MLRGETGFTYLKTASRRQLSRVGVLAVAVLLITSLPVCAATLSVNGTDNIFGAGHSTPPAPGGGSAGTLPPAVIFPAAPGQVLTFSSVTGTATLTTSFGFFAPDGNPSFGMNVSSFGGISGIKSDKSSFLAGVFLGPAEPSNPAPPVLDFTAAGLGTAFTTLSPLIDQVFYIGDGLTGTGSGTPQQFNVPATATALYLGFPDAPGYSGLPGEYQDNAGTLTATFSVPEPTSGALLLGGCVALLSKSRRRRVYASVIDRPAIRRINSAGDLRSADQADRVPIPPDADYAAPVHSNG
jgi:hypothetical protein